jgi:2'-5' RNA ligase
MINHFETIKDLDILYSKINSEGKVAIVDGQELVDPLLYNIGQDKRIGLTLLISIQGKITQDFKTLEEKIATIEQEQYFYPETDLHVTVLDLISAREDFTRDESVINQSIELIEKAVIGLAPFDIRFKGIIVSNGAILAKGYYSNGLPQLRDKIREIALERGFNLKERYQSISAHSTIVRFKSNLRNREQLLATVQNCYDLDIGVIRVRELELVIHNWYHSKKEMVRKFRLKG